MKVLDNLDKNTIFDEINADKILLIMKHKKNRSLLKKLLNKSYHVDIEDKKENIKNQYDLIICDNYYLKKYKNLLKEMQKNERPNYLPVLLITSSKRYKNMNNELQMIVSELIQKPVEKQIIKARIKNLMQTRELSLLYEKSYLSLAEDSPVGICILYNDFIRYANPEFEKICARPKSDIIGDSIFTLIKEDDHKKLKKKLNNKDDKGNKGNNPVELHINNPIEDRCVDVKLSKIIFRGKENTLLIASDVTKRKKSQERVKHLSYHDDLTDLYNRFYYEKEIERLNTERQLPLSIIMGDMNGLKMVNDAFGHDKGDQLLIKLANIIKDSCRKEDIVARLGGDEFGIVLPQTKKAEAEQISERISKKCNKVSSDPMGLSVALGIATKTKYTENIDDIFKEAEERMYRNKISESASIRNSIISSLGSTLQEKTYETKEHANRMSKLAVKMGNKLNLNSDKFDELKLLAQLHDIGKVAVPESILNKDGKLTEEEYEIVKGHSESGYRIVKSVPNLAHVAQGVLCHHERWDGNGYPQGLQGEKIPYISRIISIVDTFDVMTHERSYKDASSQEKALKEIKRCSGKQFDPNLVEIFISLF